MSTSANLEHAKSSCTDKNLKSLEDEQRVPTAFMRKTEEYRN